MADCQNFSGDKQFKFVLIGDAATGKTSLASRFTQDQFDKQYRQTAGVDFFLKRIALPGSFNVTLQLWDVGSQALSGQMLDKYLYGAHAILLIYDISNLASFENVNDWMAAIHQIFQEEEGSLPHLALVGNKTVVLSSRSNIFYAALMLWFGVQFIGDLEHMRIIKPERHLKYAQDNSMTAHGVSAKTGESVNLCFQKIAGELLGIRLTRSEQENAQPIVRAEIITANLPNTENAIPTAGNCRTSVCHLQ